MKEIKSYKLTDGRIIEDKFEAEKLQKEIDFKKKLDDFANKVGSYTQTIDAIFDAINENRDELRDMLNSLD